MLKDFTAYRLSKQLYRLSKTLRLPSHMKDQLVRASSSVALNLAEGSGKRTPEDQRRFYFIAFGSFRECEAILDLEGNNDPEISNLVNHLGAILFKLSYPTGVLKTPSTDSNTNTEQSNNERRTANANPNRP